MVFARFGYQNKTGPDRKKLDRRNARQQPIKFKDSGFRTGKMLQKKINPYLAAISSRDHGAFWPPRFPYLAAISLQHLAAYLPAEISISRCDLGENRGEIAASFWPPRFPVSRRDLGRDLGEMGKSRRPKTRRDLAAILAEIAARSRRDLVKIFTRASTQ